MQAGRQMRKLLLAPSKTKIELRRLPCAVPAGVKAVMSAKSYSEFMEDVYA
jgi:hypothetical protein